MTCTVQVTIDCRDPHPLAEWWAESLEWVVEPQDAAFIQRMVVDVEGLHEGRHGPHSWVTFTDPEGNEFCV